MNTSRHHQFRNVTTEESHNIPKHFCNDDIRRKHIPILDRTVAAIPRSVKLQGRLNYAKLLLHKIASGVMHPDTIAAIERDYQQEFKQLRAQ